MQNEDVAKQSEKWNTFRDMLTQRREELQRVIQSNEETLRAQLAPDDSETLTKNNHPADLVSGDSDFEKEIDLIRRERAEMALVSRSLTKIEQGAYGACEDCGMNIPVERLQAIPHTKYCIGCQEDLDKEAQLLRQSGLPETDPFTLA